MTLEAFIKELQQVIKSNPKAKDATVEIEYQGMGGCDTCGYGSETTKELEEGKISDLDTRVVISIL